MKFNINEYETVKERKAIFYKDYEDGRIIVKNKSINPLDYAFFEVSLYKNKEDQANNLPFSTGCALEVRDTELSVSRSGDKYESVNYSSWTENCEESAVGRALDNAGYSGNKKCSREEIEKAERMNTTMKSYNKRQASDKQRKYITDLMREKGITIVEMTKKYNLKKGDKLSAKQASDAIEWLQGIGDITDQIAKELN